MSAKFKPTKRAKEAVVDEWDASEEEEEEEEEEAAAVGKEADKSRPLPPKEGGLEKAKVVRDAWDDSELGERDDDPFRRRRANGGAGANRTLWEEANRTAPVVQPVLPASRGTLPTTLLAPRLHPSAVHNAADPSSSIGEYDARPSPQILRRDPAAGRGSSGGIHGNGLDGSERKKTLAEREEEYQRARERIFGVAAGTATTTTTAAAAAASGKGKGGAGRVRQANASANSSGSETGGRNSPATGELGRRKR